jgi:hypothetical protein
VISYFLEITKLKMMISKLLDKEEKLIKFVPSDKLDSIINLQFKTTSNNIDSKKIILDELLNVYNLKITKTNVLQKVWELKILNSTFLMNHKSDLQDESTITFSPNEIYMKSVSLNKLVEAINLNYDKYVFTKTFLTNNFNFKIKKNNFDNLRKSLKNEYGLTLEASEKEIEEINVDFKTPKK